MNEKLIKQGAAMRITKTLSHLPAGEYKKTAIDARKESADFLIEALHAGAIIKIQNSKVLDKIRTIKEKYDNGCIRITRNQLEKLQSLFTWEPNF